MIRKLIPAIFLIVDLSLVLVGLMDCKRREPPSPVRVLSRLKWDPSPDAGVLEYRIYVRTPSTDYTFGNPTAIVPADVTEWRVETLSDGRYFAVVTAATATEESPPTPEIEFSLEKGR